MYKSQNGRQCQSERLKKNLLLLLRFDYPVVHQAQRIRYNNYAKPSDQSTYRKKFFTKFQLNALALFRINSPRMRPHFIDWVAFDVSTGHKVFILNPKALIFDCLLLNVTVSQSFKTSGITQTQAYKAEELIIYLFV
jgi:hypothetical protein